MNRSTRGGRIDSGRTEALGMAAVSDDRALDAPERLEMAMAARARRVAPIDVATAFGAEAAEFARVAAALDGLAPPPPAGARFAARLEATLVEAYDDRVSRTRGGRRRSPGSVRVRSSVPSTAELAVAAAIALLLGATAISDSLGLPPALAATPTITARDTGTPLGPTGTAAHGTPAAMSTARPVAMARLGDPLQGLGQPDSR